MESAGMCAVCRRDPLALDDAGVLITVQVFHGWPVVGSASHMCACEGACTQALLDHLAGIERAGLPKAAP